MRVATYLFPLVSTVLAVISTSPFTHAANVHVLSRNVNAIQKRAQFNNVQFTFYNVGNGACGGSNVGTDHVIALSVGLYDNGSHCGETVTLTFDGKTAQATVVDECPACSVDNIDLSVGLFDFLVPEGTSAGRVTGSWSFGDTLTLG